MQIAIPFQAEFDYSSVPLCRTYAVRNIIFRLLVQVLNMVSLQCYQW